MFSFFRNLKLFYNFVSCSSSFRWKTRLLCHQKGGPTNPLNMTDDPTCLNSNECFLTLKPANFSDRLLQGLSLHTLIIDRQGLHAHQFHRKHLQWQELLALLPQSAITQAHKCTIPLQKPSHTGQNYENKASEPTSCP